MSSAAVVTKDVAAKPIGQRFSDALIERIERSQWWHWDHGTLRERLADFRDVQTFAARYLP